MTKFVIKSSMSTILLLIIGLISISGISGHHGEDHNHNPAEIALNGNQNVTSIEGDKEESLGNNGTSSSRIKRNTGNSVEGLLASCQLTNLLLYQALQQQRQVSSNPLLALATSNLQGLGSNLNLNSLPLAAAAGGLNLNGLGGANAGANLLNPFPGANQINQNLIFPSLSTFTTTSTFVTKMTTTAVITVPLLFGNKPFSTTVTRTKTFDVTTSEIKTLTTTITPTTVTTQVIAPTSVQKDVVTPTSVNSLDQTKISEYDAYEEADANYQNDVQEDRRAAASNSNSNKRGNLRSTASLTQDTAENIPDQYAASAPAPFKPTKSRGEKRRKTRPTTPTQQQEQRTTPSNSRSKSSSKYIQKEETPKTSQRYNPAEDDYYSARPAEKKRTTPKQDVNENSFYNRQYGSTIQEDDIPVDDDPAAVQYPDDYSYYARRLKRGEQFDDDEDQDEHTKLDREYLLEPSSDGDYSGNYQKYEKCPPIPVDNFASTVTVTSIETRTITKFLKGQASSSSNINNNFYAHTPAAANTRTFTPTGRSRSAYNKRERHSSDSDAAASSYTTTTTEKTTTDRRAQILRRGRSRYTPSNDYEYRG